MKKIPATERREETEKSASAKSAPSSAPAASDVERGEADDPMAGLQADLDRFRDLALRSQADFENYKKRAAREKEDAIKYANSSLLERLVTIVDNFQLGLEAARAKRRETNSIQTCTKRLRMSRARSFRKVPSSVRRAAVTG